MNRPRVCFVVESGTDVRLVEGLIEICELTILARKIKGGVEISQPPSKFVRIRVGPSARLQFAWFAWRNLWAEKHGFDIFLVQGYGVAALAANLAGRLVHKPVIMLVCSPTEAYYRCRMSNPDGATPYRRHKAWLLDMLAHVNAKLAGEYVVLSKYLAEVVRAHGARSPIHVVPVYGVDTQIFVPPGEPRCAIRARLNLPTTGALILFSSRIAPEKDSEALLRAVRRLLESGRDIWLLHRSGGYKAFLRDAERFGIVHRVIASDAVHPHRQLAPDYQACDLCVQASREEGLGFSPLEALACATPVIAAAVGGLKETIVDGRTGWTYSVGDAEGLARCIKAVLDDPAEAARRAFTGRSIVRTRYDRRFVFRQLAGILAEVLQ
ncbi:MAG TPA: glycosyltransferase family 4 protein [Terriglobales bacterium]|nr:glycosyltransferase family 4 protein [Terriglobales bacterium]